MMVLKTTPQPFTPTAAPPIANRSHGRRLSSLDKFTCHATTEHARYVTEVAYVAPKPGIDPLVSVLQAQGRVPVAPSDRSGLHPLLVPLAQSTTNGQLTCLLRWPEGHKGMELPVVCMARGDRSITLLARSIDEYLHRALAEEDFDAENSSSAVATAAGEYGTSIYEHGAVTRSGLPSLQAYLARRAGMFPDVCESLALGHLAKGDTMSALITSEWYMRRGHFPEWGRPYEFAVQLMKQVGRAEESRDVSRIALRMPWWTLADGFEAMRDEAGLRGGAQAVADALAEQDDMGNGGVLKGSGIKFNPKSDRQKRLDEAALLMNRAAAGEMSWDDIREGVAEELEAAGLIDVARFTRAA